MCLGVPFFTVHFPSIDLDIDSDGTGAVERSNAEDIAELDSTKGQFLQVFSGDFDEDQKIDTFDFDGIAGLFFAPVFVSLSSNLVYANASQISLTFDYDDAGLTEGDNGLFRLWKKDASQQRTSNDLVPSGTSIDASSIGLAPGSSITLYLEAINPTRRTVNFDPLSVTAAVTGSPVWNGQVADKVFASGIEIDLDASTIENNNSTSGVLDDDREETDGAFLPVNSDDDDYDKDNKSDLKQDGEIKGESDLLPIALRKVKRGGTFQLEIPDHLRVWENSNRTEKVTSDTKIDASKTTVLYVEGIKKDSGEIKLSWTLGKDTIANGDRVKVTAFQWTGPLNVPGYSVHNYKAEGALNNSQWVTPSKGSVKEGVGTSDVKILWGEGGEVGKAIYKVDDNYKWELEVNVVKVEVSIDSQLFNKINYEGKPVQIKDALIQSSDEDVAMSADIFISNIEGPVINGISRGLRFIELGFIQNVQFTEMHGDFDQLPQVGDPDSLGRRRQYDLVTRKYVLDGITKPVFGDFPWYDSENQSGSLFNDAKGVLRDLGDEAVTNKILDMSDRPRQSGSDSLTLTENEVTDALDRISLIQDFDLFLAVRTTEQVNGSEKVFTQRAKASWSFNGSGTFDAAGVWKADDAAGVTGSKKFSGVTSGEVVPVTTELFANSIIGNFSTEDQP